MKKLIMIEGLPGSGKTTLAGITANILNKSKIKNRCFFEGNLKHPADYEGELKMFSNFKELIERLKNNNNVVGIIRYGSREVDDMSAGGDFDLFIIVNHLKSEIESLHFYVKGIPVDLGIRTIDDLKDEKPLSFIDHAIKKGEIFYDELITFGRNENIVNLQEKGKDIFSKLLS